MTKLRWKWSFVDLRGDGRFPKERLKGKINDMSESGLCENCEERVKKND